MTPSDYDEEFLDWISEVAGSGLRDEFPVELEYHIVEAARRLGSAEKPKAWAPSLAQASILAIVIELATPDSTSGLAFMVLLLIAGLYAAGTNRVLGELPAVG